MPANNLPAHLSELSPRPMEPLATSLRRSVEDLLWIGTLNDLLKPVISLELRASCRPCGNARLEVYVPMTIIRANRKREGNMIMSARRRSSPRAW